MSALDADAPILDMLRAEADDLATPRGSLKCKFHNKPLLAPERPISAISSDFVIGPGVMTFALRQLAPRNTPSWIVLPHSWYGGPHQPTDGLEPMALRGWLPDGRQHFQNVFTL